MLPMSPDVSDGIAGVVAKFITPGRNEPSGLVLTALLGRRRCVHGHLPSQALGWYGPNQGARLVGAVVGAVLVLLVWGALLRRRGA